MLRQALQASSGVDVYCSCLMLPWGARVATVLGLGLGLLLGVFSGWCPGCVFEQWLVLTVVCTVALVAGLARFETRAFVPRFGAHALPAGNGSGGSGAALAAGSGHWTAALTLPEAAALLLEFSAQAE